MIVMLNNKVATKMVIDSLRMETVFLVTAKICKIRLEKTNIDR